MKRRVIILAVCATATASVVAAVRINHWLDIDACLDAGGAWDHGEGECRHR